jgi:hypothetical protein
VGIKVFACLLARGFHDQDTVMEVHLLSRLQALEKQFAAHKAAAVQRTGEEIDQGRDVADRLDVLEFNMSRLLLIVQALLETCRSKKLFSELEFETLLGAIDLSDGRADGLLDPNSVPGMQAAPKPTSFLSFLRQAEKAAAEFDSDPRTFLAQLEQAE